jgi:uncharacterized RDD family membrane protein YckC
MSYEDRIRIETPEGVDLELTLAGLGSRIGAAVIDGAIRGATYLALFLILAFAAGAIEAPWLLLAFYVPLVLLIEVGYDIAFETLNSGRTLGKAALGIRVVRMGGEPVDFRASGVRNLLRLVDGVVTMYIAGLVSIFVTRNNQRLGDLAAGTIVIRDRDATFASSPAAYEYPLPERSGSWDVSSVTADELATLRRFLERRRQLTIDARTRLATQLAARVRTKIAGVPELIHPEALIEEVVRSKSR